jgi:hypothetical protein
MVSTSQAMGVFRGSVFSTHRSPFTLYRGFASFLNAEPLNTEHSFQLCVRSLMVKAVPLGFNDVEWWLEQSMVPPNLVIIP